MITQEPELKERTPMERKLDAQLKGKYAFRRRCYQLWQEEGLDLKEIAQRVAVNYNTFYPWYLRWRDDAAKLRVAAKEENTKEDEGLVGWLDIPHQPRDKKKAA